MPQPLSSWDLPRLTQLASTVFLTAPLGSNSFAVIPALPPPHSHNRWPEMRVRASIISAFSCAICAETPLTPVGFEELINPFCHF